MPARNKVKIGLIQMSVPVSKGSALVKAEKMIRQAAAQGAKIISLSELFNTPYFPQKQKLDKDRFAETVPGPTVGALQSLARKLGVVLIVPIYEKRKDRYYNVAVVINEKGKILGRYDKIHLPQDPGFYEKDYFEHGQSGFKVFKTKYAPFAVLICYDQWIPEAARVARLMGAQIIFYPTALGDIIGYKPEGDWHDAWETVQRGHAIANSVHVAVVNRVGREGRMQFFGQSFIADPFGKVLKLAGKTKDQILVAQLDLARNEFFAEGWGFLRNRRPETYKILTANKYVEKSRKLKDVPHYKLEKRALKGK